MDFENEISRLKLYARLAAKEERRDPPNAIFIKEAWEDFESYLREAFARVYENARHATPDA